MTRHKKAKFKLKSLYLWHRYLGISAAAFVVLLSITGLMLNHTNELSLSKKQVTSNWLLNWYGIEAPDLVATYHSDNFYVSQWNNEFYLNQFHIGKFDGLLLGMATRDELIIIAITGKILLTTTAGEIIEVLGDNQGLPSGIKKIGVTSSGSVIVATTDGYYRANDDFINWRHDEVKARAWSMPTVLPEEIYTAIKTSIRHHSIHYERVTLDLHSGRFFGSWGIYLMDAAAIILILLSITGTSLWFIRIIKQKKHKQGSNNP